MSKIVTNIAELVGNTPLMELVGYEKNMTSKQRCSENLNISTHPEASRTVQH